jgi:hypothetical protein
VEVVGVVVELVRGEEELFDGEKEGEFVLKFVLLVVLLLLFSKTIVVDVLVMSVGEG